MRVSLETGVYTRILHTANPHMTNLKWKIDFLDPESYFFLLLVTIVEPLICLDSVSLWCVSIFFFLAWKPSQPRVCIAWWSLSCGCCIITSFWCSWLFLHFKIVHLCQFSHAWPCHCFTFWFFSCWLVWFSWFLEIRFLANLEVVFLVYWNFCGC